MKSYMAVVVAVVLAAGMVIGTAGAVLADSEGEGVSGTTNPAQWTDLGNASGNAGGGAVAQTDSWKTRGPVEAGVLPARTVKSEDGQWLNMDVSEQNSSPQLRGFPNIQAGP